MLGKSFAGEANRIEFGGHTYLEQKFQKELSVGKIIYKKRYSTFER